MKTSVKYLFTLLFMLACHFSQGQNAEMADTFRAEGKIYVVVAIVLIVLFGLILYLIVLDRKMNRLERMMQEKRQTKQADKSF